MSYPTTTVCLLVVRGINSGSGDGDVSPFTALDQTKLSKLYEWIAMKFCTDIHVPLRLNSNPFGP